MKLPSYNSPMLIPYYGSKVKLAPLYPRPLYQDIVEPFAGGAGYSLLYADRRVTLVEKWPLLAALWRYLINVSSEEILRLPLVTHVDELGSACEEAKWLVGWWLNTCTATPRKQGSNRYKSNERPNSFWGEKRRALISRQVQRIKHWEINETSYEDIDIDPIRPATWFVDPPYQVAGKRYVHSSATIDFSHLGRWCQHLPGQAIVCENYGASWLPFKHFANAKSSAWRGKMVNEEAIWTNDESAGVVARQPLQLEMFGGSEVGA
jgi:hypothetical protein